jgi:hypothetical protein
VTEYILVRSKMFSWASTAARWKISAVWSQRRKRQTGGRPMLKCLSAWNEWQARRMPILFSPTMGPAVKAGYWFLWVRCPACRTTNAIDSRSLDCHRDAAVSSLIPALSCRSCRPNAPFAELGLIVDAFVGDTLRRRRRGALHDDALRDAEDLDAGTRVGPRKDRQRRRKKSSLSSPRKTH